MDLYLVLGLEPGASTADIKRAYRRLARRYHPGINPGDRAAEVRFRQITEAYETLVDPARRQAYEAGAGHAPAEPPKVATLHFAEFDFSVAADGPQAATFTELFAEVLHPVPASDRGRPQHGADLHATLRIPFLDAARGAERQVVVTRQHVCGVCSGRGALVVEEARCPQCHGSGSVRWARGHMVFAKACPGCEGTGRRRRQSCGACGGHGRTVHSEAVPVVVPPGTPDGTRLRIAERGHAGVHGGRTGDLYVTVQVDAHPFFAIDGDTLSCTVPVALHEALLGARIDVPTLDGPVKLRIPPGTQPGQRFRLEGRGIPRLSGGRGDLVVAVRLVLPVRIDERSRELIREFGERNNADVRQALHGGPTPASSAPA